MLNHQLVLLAKDAARGTLDLLREPLVRRFPNAEIIFPAPVLVPVGLIVGLPGSGTAPVLGVLQLLLQAPDVLHEQNCEGGKGTFA